MQLDIVVRPEARHQCAAGTALLSGLKRHGMKARIVSSTAEADAPLAACWGWRNARSLGPRRKVLVMEAGYVGDRGFQACGDLLWHSLAWDGLNGRGRVPPVSDGGKRWRKHFAGLLKAWRNEGEYIVVMGQVPGDAAIESTDIEKWYGRAAEAMNRFGLPIRFRPHPVAAERGYAANAHGIARISGSLTECLSHAWLAVTFNSNSGVDAALNGVPVIACDRGSMAWPIAAQGLLADPIRPDRTAWCEALAWRQWTLAEMASGEAWEYVAQTVQ